MSATHPTPVDKTLVRNRLIYARRRLSDLLALGEKIYALAQERQQLTEEFFFHTVAAIEMLTQLVNEGRSLGIPMEEAKPWRVAGALPEPDPIKALLLSLYANPNNSKWYPRPADLYDHAGLVWRLWNYRHQVSHRGRNPFLLQATIGGPDPDPAISLILDPGDHTAGHSSKSVQAELQGMLGLVEQGCEVILAHLPD